jgi:hypothetical protein
MEELTVALDATEEYAKLVSAAFNMAMRCIMDSNCYELTRGEIAGDLLFFIPAGRDHDIHIRCTHQEVLAISIWTTWQLQMGCSITINLENPNKIRISINGKKLKDVSWLNPKPAIRHCCQLVQDLNLPEPQAKPIE